MPRKRTRADRVADVVDLLDQDDQDQLVRDMEQDMEKQERHIESAFRAVCRAVALLSIAAGCIVQRLRYQQMKRRGIRPTEMDFQLLCMWAHVVLAALLHWNTCQWVVFRDNGNPSPMVGLSRKKLTPVLVGVLGLLVAAIGLFCARLTHAEASFIGYHGIVYLHYSLFLSNLVVVAGAMFIRIEQTYSKKMMDDLRESQYHFKSI